ncbi:DinB family protein [Rossellomorea sp. NPDC071047]|uniref:DinB family protein n=1 Tax=Rossellomorea sp. NPDC071047 TaxID=3390675 RepID=UPI003D051254
MNAKQVLLIQLDACLDQNTWFVSLINSIKDLTEEQATWKPNEATNSISEIVHHLIYYNQRHLNRLKGIENEESTGESTFRNKEGLNWSETYERIDQLMADWKKEVEEADEVNLTNWTEIIAHLTIHTTYHGGQILYIRKLQESWNPQAGVKG